MQKESSQARRRRWNIRMPRRGYNLNKSPTFRRSMTKDRRRPTTGRSRFPACRAVASTSGTSRVSTKHLPSNRRPLAATRLCPPLLCFRLHTHSPLRLKFTMAHLRRPLPKTQPSFCHPPISRPRSSMVPYPSVAVTGNHPQLRNSYLSPATPPSMAQPAHLQVRSRNRHHRWVE